MAQSIQNICDLPPELLEQIFSWLEDVNDFQSVINTCPLWHDIMEYRKAENLFAQVLPILMEKEIRIHHRPYPLNNFATFRQVCKKWKQETDRLLALYRFETFDCKAYRFYGAQTMQRFLTHASALPEGINPILGNWVSFTGVDERDFGLCMQLIRGYGTYIKSIHLGSHIHVNRFPFHELQLALTFLPNLEYLYANAYVEDWTVGYQVLALPPLPLLKELFLLTEITMPWSTPDYRRHQQLTDSFVTAYGPHLEILTCSPLLLRLESISDRLPNLTSLEIEGMRGMSITLDDIHTLSRADWKLQYLEIASFGAPTIQCSTALMEMLNNFRATLVSLYLSIQLEESLEPSDLNVFPCLKRVSLRVNSTFSVFPEDLRDRLNLFSVVCPNLKILYITTVGKNMNEAVREELQFAEMEGVFQQLQNFTHGRYHSDVHRM
ncbi:unnamed protein product [Orchesella dallaii]|uniref:F-box domain-containing protein n=1 Tax=Orchesella dallaii TaxID=48710 RepID=A0ABP1RYF2_9HEXA